jgi:streptogramin lyase
MIDDARIGSELGGYRLEGVLGRGGMGVVYLAEHVQLGRKVALKVLSPELATDERFRDRFVRESKIAASLEHPNIVPVYEASEAAGSLFIAMRFIRGTDLKTLIRQVGPLGPERALPLLAQVASALDAAHAEDLVHRDVKPGNILVAPAPGANEPEHAYLTDFGLTKRVTSESGITATGQFVGTFDYAAPEQFEGKPLDARTDVYSLTCVLYECLTGEVPFPREQDVALMFAHTSAQPPKVTQKRPELPKAVDDVIATGMSKVPDERFRTAGELLRTARGVLGGEEIDLPEIRAWKKRRRRLVHRRRRRILVAATAALVAIALTVTAILVASSEAPPPVGIAKAALVRIDPKTNKIAGQPIELGAGGGPVVVGDGSVWVADTRADQIVRVDPTGGIPAIQIPLGSTPVSMVAVEEQKALYVVTPTKLWRVSMETNTATATKILPSAAADVGFADGAVWVTAGAPPEGPPSGLLIRADPAQLFLTQSQIPEPGALAFGSGSVWVRGLDVTRLDPKTSEVTATVDLPLTQELPFAPGDNLIEAGGSLWTVDLNGTIYRVDPTKNEVALPSIATKVPATDMAIGEGAIWVLSRLDASLVRVDLATGQTGPTVKLDGDPIAVAAGDGVVWVVRNGG